MKTKNEILKAARLKRDTEHTLLKTKDLPLTDYQNERRRISAEYKAVLEANKPTYHRLSAWQREDNASFERWQKLQNNS